ncbi:MAG: hypothetical protein HOW59_37140 [Nonomuraea sp.]|nr:hypothetical protein [Nonomuraea sp.]NUQ33260.1 hypothetical protein [Dermatophilaceae bacterium]NUR81078.1 hypothetical protein [Dermatophilaceae bacterium]
MSEPTVHDIAASLPHALQGSFGFSTIDGSQMEGFTWSAHGRDLELVVDDATDTVLDATIWDNTDEDPVQVVTVRLHVEVIA